VTLDFSRPGKSTDNAYPTSEVHVDECRIPSEFSG
jgi:hypothetical protein